MPRKRKKDPTGGRIIKGAGKPSLDYFMRGIFTDLYKRDRRDFENRVNIRELKDAAEDLRDEGKSDEYIKKNIEDRLEDGEFFTVDGFRKFIREVKQYMSEGPPAWTIHPIAAIKRAVHPTYLDKVSNVVRRLSKEDIKYLSPHTKEDIYSLRDMTSYRKLSKAMEREGIKKKYKVLEEESDMRKYAKNKLEKIETEYQRKMKTATVIFLAAGTFLLALSSANITGMVIAGNEIPVGYPVAAGFILLVAGLFFSLRKKKGKKTEKQNPPKKQSRKKAKKKK